MNKSMSQMCSLVLVAIPMLVSVSFASDGGSSSAGVPAPTQKDVSSEILNHPVVLNTEKLLNDKYGGQCVLPSTPQDIRWMCTGALPVVTQPMIFPSSCGFAITIVCARDVTTITGRTTSFFVLNPPGQPSTIAPTEKLIIIENVQEVQAP
jgi:hypothetical protein